MIYSTATKKQIKKGVDVLPIRKAEVDHYWDLLKFMVIQGLKHGGDLMNEQDLKKENFNLSQEVVKLRAENKYLKDKPIES